MPYQDEVALSDMEPFDGILTAAPSPGSPSCFGSLWCVPCRARPPPRRQLWVHGRLPLRRGVLPHAGGHCVGLRRCALRHVQPRRARPPLNNEVGDARPYGQRARRATPCRSQRALNCARLCGGGRRDTASASREGSLSLARRDPQPPPRLAAPAVPCADACVPATAAAWTLTAPPKSAKHER